MTGLVDGHGPLLLGQQGVGRLAPTEQDPVPGLSQIQGSDRVAVVAHGHDGRLVL